ncbi:uncharacterized protein LOC120024395 isoform X1 [Salvelinus namaycush]|uniref:Uncharacterized protein LOC120024395 isoform X1 n=1 Tax=Salvelinus namaycush TaxID=8040 RepID=A0A8U0PG84_SALNM|nr:uncharacterized protein LOC120024395 isoform X1 [Salvelinus namaycush]
MLNCAGCWISCVIRKVSMKLIYVYLGCQLVSCVSAQTVGCNNTVHANGTMTYQLPKPMPGSPSTCVRQWLDGNGTVLTNDDDIDKDRVLVQTSQSITIIGCMDRLKYLEECTLNKTNSNRKVECLRNCIVKPFDQESIEPEHKICFGVRCVSGITFGLTFGVSAAVVIIIILVLLIRYKIHLYRVCMFVGHRLNGTTREPFPDTEKPLENPLLTQRSPRATLLPLSTTPL